MKLKYRVGTTVLLVIVAAAMWVKIPQRKPAQLPVKPVASTPAKKPTVPSTPVASKSPAVVDDDEGWPLYQAQRRSLVVLRNQLVPRAQLTPVSGFIRQIQVTTNDGTRVATGCLIDLAVFSGDARTPSAMTRRPQLWKCTGETALLVNHVPPFGVGELTWVDAEELPRFANLRTFQVGREPSFEEWKQLVSSR